MRPAGLVKNIQDVSSARAIGSRMGATFGKYPPDRSVIASYGRSYPAIQWRRRFRQRFERGKVKINELDSQFESIAEKDGVERLDATVSLDQFDFVVLPFDGRRL
jgi:hypothetical protein